MSTTATAEFFELKSDVFFAEGVAWRARRWAHHCEAYSTTLHCSVRIRYYLKRAQGRIDKIRSLIGRLEIENDSQREDLREIAVQLAGLAEVFAEMHSDWIEVISPRLRDTFPSLGLLGPWIESPLEDLTCATEDAAETLALASSKPFVELVEKELDSLDVGT